MPREILFSKNLRWADWNNGKCYHNDDNYVCCAKGCSVIGPDRLFYAYRPDKIEESGALYCPRCMERIRKQKQKERRQQKIAARERLESLAAELQEIKNLI